MAVLSFGSVAGPAVPSTRIQLDRKTRLFIGSARDLQLIRSGLVAWVARRCVEVHADLVIGLNGGAEIYLLQPQGPM